MWDTSRQLKLKTLIFLWCYFNTGIGFAEITIFGINIPGLHQPDGRGAYDHLFRKTVLNHPHRSLIVLPPARAMKSFKRCKDCCISPVSEQIELKDPAAPVDVSKPFNYARVYIFVGPSKTSISSLQALRGKKIGLRLGMPYPPSVMHGPFKKLQVTSLKQTLQLLESKRVDAVIAYAPDVYIQFKELEMEPLPHQKDMPLAEYPDALVCRQRKNKSLVDEFDRKIDQLRQSGELRQILGDHYLEKL